MKIEVELREIGSYKGVVRVFRGWQTAQEWIGEAFLAGGPEVEVVVKVAKEPEVEVQLPFNDVCAIDDDAEIERVLR